MTNSKKEAQKKKRATKIELKEHLTNVFLVQFVVAIVYSIYTWGQMFIWQRFSASHAILAHNLTPYTMWGSVIIATILIVLPFVFKNFPTNNYWRTACYFFAFLGLLYCILNLHIALGKLVGDVAWLAWAKFGNEWSGLKFQFAWIWLGFLVCFIIYLVRYNRISKMK